MTTDTTYMTDFYLNIYDNTTANVWTEYFKDFKTMYNRFLKLKYSKKLWVISHSKFD